MAETVIAIAVTVVHCNILILGAGRIVDCLGGRSGSGWRFDSTVKITSAFNLIRLLLTMMDEKEFKMFRVLPHIFDVLEK